jgi:hypothetical protein
MNRGTNLYFPYTVNGNHKAHYDGHSAPIRASAFIIFFRRTSVFFVRRVFDIDSFQR